MVHESSDVGILGYERTGSHRSGHQRTCFGIVLLVKTLSVFWPVARPVSGWSLSGHAHLELLGGISLERGVYLQEFDLSVYACQHLLRIRQIVFDASCLGDNEHCPRAL